MLDYVRYIINKLSKEGFSEAAVETAIWGIEKKGISFTHHLLQEKYSLDPQHAQRLINGVLKELKQLRNESIIRGIVFIAFFTTVGILAFRAQGFWISYICFAITAIRLLVIIRSLIRKVKP